MRRLHLAAGCLIATGMVVVPVGNAVADRLPGSDHGGLVESATLLPTNQVPQVASAGSGTATITLNPGHDEICFQITFSNLTSPAIAAHIHEGPAGTNGNIVVPFSLPDDLSTSGTVQGCVSPVATTTDPSLLSEIRSDPAGFYVNVHTTLHTAGEIRGQLTRGQ